MADFDAIAVLRLIREYSRIPAVPGFTDEDTLLLARAELHSYLLPEVRRRVPRGASLSSEELGPLIALRVASVQLQSSGDLDVAGALAEDLLKRLAAFKTVGRPRGGKNRTTETDYAAGVAAAQREIDDNPTSYTTKDLTTAMMEKVGKSDSWAKGVLKKARDKGELPQGPRSARQPTPVQGSTARRNRTPKSAK